MRRITHTTCTSAPLLAGFATLFFLCALGCGPVDADPEDPNDPEVNNNDDEDAVDESGCLILTSEDVAMGATLEVPEQGCYGVPQDLTVTGGTLELEPGVRMEFAEGAGLRVAGGGRLKAQGSAEEQIVLTGKSASRGAWQGVSFQDTNSPDNVLDHVVIEYAGGQGWNGSSLSRACLYALDDGVRLSVTNSVFRECGQVGFQADGPEADISVASTSFEQNDAPIWVAANLVGSLAPDLSFEGNDDPAILATSGGSSEITTEQTWPALEVNYRVDRTLRVRELLTLSPGVTIEFEQDQGIDIAQTGRLSAVGTVAGVIALTGTEESRGFWKGLHYEDTNSSQNELEYVIVSYAGSEPWSGSPLARAGIFLERDGVQLSMKNVTIEGSGRMGLYANGAGANLTLEDVLYTDNDAPVALHPNLVGALDAGSDYTGNDEDVVEIERGDVTTDATWQELNVPYLVSGTVRLDGGDLTIAPGTTVEFRQDQGIDVQEGKLVADASEGETIEFIAADGEMGVGFWNGIQIETTRSNVLSNVLIRSGGSAGWDGGEDSRAGVFVSNTGALSMTDVTLENNGNVGVSVRDGGMLTQCSGVTGSGNENAEARSPERMNVGFEGLGCSD